MANVHIGKKIREVLDKSSLTVVDFARRINLSRDGAYKIFAKKFIDTDQLSQISKVLDHDFFSYYSAAVKDQKNTYGYATKDEVENLTKVVHTLAIEIKKLREELPRTKPKTTTKRSKK